jgi:LysM repeat protein
VTDLQKLNPGITCPNLDTSKSYCVVGTATDEPTPPTSTTTTATQPTTTDSAPSNSPTMPGIASNCDGFHKVSSGDQCYTIAKKYSITEAQFKSWNSQVDASKSFLFSMAFVDMGLLQRS